MNYATGGDLYRGLNGYNSFVQSQYTTTGEFAVPGLSSQFNGELFYRLTDHISAGLSIGYFEHKKESQVAYVYAKLVDVAETVSPKYYVVPLTLSVHYSINWMGPYWLDFSLGAEMYRTRLKFAYSETATIAEFTGSEVYTFDSKKRIRRRSRRRLRMGR